MVLYIQHKGSFRVEAEAVIQYEHPMLITKNVRQTWSAKDSEEKR